MFNKTAIWLLVVGSVLFFGGLWMLNNVIEEDVRTQVRGYRAHERSPLEFLCPFSMVFGLVFLGFGARELRNYPSKYIPSELYLIRSVHTNSDGILLGLQCASKENSMEPEIDLKKIEAGLAKTRNFFLHRKWLTPDPAVREGYLICARFKNHPVISVNPDFFNEHCMPKEPAKAANAAA